MAARHSTHLSRREYLPSLVYAAFHADPHDRLIAPVGQHRYATLFGIIPDALAVLRAAASIESDPNQVMAWYTGTRIMELGDLTAEKLVAIGRAEEVVSFLLSIGDGRRN
jgi:hypothetical protein